MRSFKYLALCAVVVGAGSLLRPLQAQQPASVVDLRAASDAIQTLQDQQKTIAANQAKIDSKLATIVEDVRIARLYAARVR